jgi:hypothetical protein
VTVIPATIIKSSLHSYIKAFTGGRAKEHETRRVKHPYLYPLLDIVVKPSIGFRTSTGFGWGFIEIAGKYSTSVSGYTRL